MKFKELGEEDVIYTSDLYYDLFDGGYIKPKDLLESEEDVNKVYEAMQTIQQFLYEAEENNVIEIN